MSDGIYQAELGGSTWGAAMPRIRVVTPGDHDHDEYDSDYATRLNGLSLVQRTHSLSTGRRIGHLLGKDSLSNDIPLKVIKEYMIDFDVGDAFILALAQSGEIIAWGENTYGQLDVPAAIYRLLADSNSPNGYGAVEPCPISTHEAGTGHPVGRNTTTEARCRDRARTASTALNE